MADMKIILDGIEVDAQEGMTILEAAETQGIDIPSLCHARELLPQGVCRVCVVEVEEGMKTLVGACHTTVSPGMTVQTHSSKVLAARKATVELLLTAHTGDCVTDTNAKNCVLHNLASDLEVGPPRFRVRSARNYPVEAVSPYVRRDLSKCIMCRKCIGACREIAGKGLFSTGYRSFESKIVFGRDDPLDTEECRDCGICIEHCPTGALSVPPAISGEPADNHSSTVSGKANADADPPKGADRSDLLNLLKMAKGQEGFVSPDSLSQIAEDLHIPINEVYGVATFYSFLPVEPIGRNLIRICNNLPCYLKNAATIVESVAKEIGISPGETTADERFTFELTNCIGACDMAPAMLVNDDLHGHLTPEKIRDVLKSYT